uniref:Large ribosomal subunit protein uL4 n=1 Tax=candidate division WOR-3 bacterium TaxID=2052148 RepID=A0A7C4YJ40_UNCW3
MSINTKLFGSKGEEKGTITLPEIFSQEVNEDTIYYAVKRILADQRQGNAKAKTKGEVSGGGRKPWRQKGTGRARAGSIRSPLWRGGGVIFGPRPRDFSFTIPKKLRKKALLSAFSQRAKEGRVFVVEKPSLTEPKTKVIVEMLKNMGIYGSKVLFLYDGNDMNLYKSSRNIENLTIVEAYKSNPYLVLMHKYILITEDGLKQIEGVFK